MATLYIENVPDELYDAIRAKAKAKRKSIAAEVLVVLEQNFPTARELKARREFLRRVKLLQSAMPSGTGPFPSTEEMQREDRLR
jgi:plasmid stability protein